MSKFSIFAAMCVLLCFLVPGETTAKTRLACSDVFQLALEASSQELAVVHAQTETFNIDCGQGLVRGFVLAAGTPISVLDYIEHFGVEYALVETPGRVLVAVRSRDVRLRNRDEIEVFAWDTDGVSLCRESTACGNLYDTLIGVPADAFGQTPDLWRRVSPDTPMAQCGQLAKEQTELCLAPFDETPGAPVEAALSGKAVQVVPPPGSQTQIPKPLWRTMPVRNIEDLGAMVANAGLSPELGGFDQLNSINTKDCGIPYSAAGLYFKGINRGLQQLQVAEDWKSDGASSKTVSRALAKNENAVVAGRVSPQNRLATASNPKTKPSAKSKDDLFKEAFLAPTGESRQKTAMRSYTGQHPSRPDRTSVRDPNAPTSSYDASFVASDILINPEAMQHFFALLLFQTVESAATPVSLAPATVDVICQNGKPFQAKAMTINLPAVGKPLLMNDEKVVALHGRNIRDYVYDAEYFQVYGLYGGYSMDVKNRFEFFLWQTVLQDVWEQDEHVRDAFPDPDLRRYITAGLRDISMAMTVQFSRALLEPEISDVILFEDLLSTEDF